MADQIEEPQNEEDVQIKETNSFIMDSDLALSRYIFLRSLQPSFSSEQKKKLTRLWMNADWDVDEHIRTLSEANPSAPGSLLKKAVESKTLRSNDEVLWCLAFCLCETKNEELHKWLRDNLLALIPTSNDLLYFMNYFKMKGKEGSLSFARGMRNALHKWYDARSASELLEIIFATHSVHGIGHDFIVRKLHLKLEDNDKNDVVKAAFMTHDDLEKAAKTSSTMNKILIYKNLKRCKEITEILAILKRKEFNYKIHHLPTNAVKSVEVIELILPNMTLTEILDNLENFCNRKLLKVQEPLNRKICNALQCSSKTITEAKLNCFYVYQVMKMLEHKMTIIEGSVHKSENGAVSVAASENKPKEKSATKKFSNPFIFKKLQNILSQTLNEQPKTGCRFYVTVDFRRFSKRQSQVYGMTNGLCAEVQAILTLSLLKNEKDVTVMTFTDEKHKLKPVNWSAETTFEKAMEIYENEIKEKPKTKENIGLPLKKAAEDKKKIDVFITFVSSVARTKGMNPKPLVRELEAYRNAMNSKKTKMIVVNLTRKAADFKYDNSNINERGILEIAGFSPASMKVIEAFAKNCFA